MAEIKTIQSLEEISASYPVMVQLRPHMNCIESYIEQVQAQMTEGYGMIGVKVDGKFRALAGYRVSTNLYLGKNLYADDLITDENHRSLGYGKLMMDYLVEHARALGCTALHLDSGTERKDAHRFYFREGMHQPSQHFLIHLAT